MYRTEYLVIFAGLVSVSNAFGGGVPMPPSQPLEGGVQGDQHIYPCFTAINCALVGTPDHDKLKDCLSVMDQKDREIGVSWLIDEGDDTQYEDEYHALNVTYCGLDKDTRKKKFDHVIQSVFELYSVGCESRYEKTTCEHWEEMTECSADLLDQLNSEGKCDVSEFDKD